MRHWCCPNCKASNDRGINASINILHECLRCLQPLKKSLMQES
ncbi:MAG: hypothetical protein RBS14_01740 [Atribacterota bacterium]|nr:hypothetical protein [Atribacterota bacterium]